MLWSNKNGCMNEVQHFWPFRIVFLSVRFVVGALPLVRLFFFCMCVCAIVSNILSSSSYMLFKAFAKAMTRLSNVVIRLMHMHIQHIFMPQELSKFKVLKHLWNTKPFLYSHVSQAKNDHCKILEITKSRSFSMQKVFFSVFIARSKMLCSFLRPPLIIRLVSCSANYKQLDLI